MVIIKFLIETLNIYEFYAYYTFFLYLFIYFMNLLHNLKAKDKG